MSKNIGLVLSVISCIGLLANPFAIPQPRFAGVAARLNAEIGNYRMGIYVIPLDNPSDAFGVNADAQVPSASAWKGGGIIYFFEHVDPVITNSVPVMYWERQGIIWIPPAYQAAWFKYIKVLHDAYIMTVFSGNHEAGNILAYVYHLSAPPSARNPIVAFNNWSLSIDMTPQSGMRQWMAGGTWAAGYVDPRYDQRSLFPDNPTLVYNVTYSARDLANFYYHLATAGKQQGYYAKAVELLSIRNEVTSLIQACPQTSPSTGMLTATKQGYFRPDSPDSLGHDVDNDAGLLIFPDGATYAVAFTTFDAHNIGPAIVCETIQAIVADHEQHSMF